MLHGAGFVKLRAHFPQFFEADAIGLWLTVISQAEFLVQLFCQVSMATLTKYGHLGEELHPSLKGVLEAKWRGSESKPVDRTQTDTL